VVLGAEHAKGHGGSLRSLPASLVP
jgi:hypothetical protein